MMNRRSLLSAALLVTLASLAPSCAPLTPEELAARQKRQQEEAAQRARDRVAYHHVKIVAASYELREELAVELTSRGFDVVNSDETPWNWGNRESAPTGSYGAVATVRVTDSRPAWVTHGSYPSYTLSNHDGRPAYKTQLEVVVNDAQGRHLHTYYGTSRASESWNRRESERSALRAAMRFFPQNDNLTW